MDPEAGIGGAELGVEALEPMYPFLYARGARSIYRANFGGDFDKRPFVYPVPEGVLPGY